MYYTDLMEANRARQKLWNKGDTTNGPLYATVELAGEVGEVCNIVKKLERERRGMVGSRSNMYELEEEIGDVMICLYLLAAEFGIDPWRAAVEKFNRTSKKLDFPVMMVDPR